MRHVLDFLALARWHPAVRLALAALLLVPILSFSITDRWFLVMLHSLGRRALAMSDVQNPIDGIGIGYQLVLIGGLPLLFAQHLLCRLKPKSRALPWMLLPVLLVGTLVATVVMVTIIHFSRPYRASTPPRL